MNQERADLSTSAREHSGDQTVAVLVEARKLIEKPENWGQGIRASREVGTSCCASEAIEDVLYLRRRFSIETFGAAARALSTAANLPKGTSIPDWNDAPERTHAEVLAAFDRAIEAAKQSSDDRTDGKASGLHREPNGAS